MIECYTPDEVAQMLKVPVSVIKQAIRERELDAIEINRNRRIIEPAAIRRYFELCRQKREAKKDHTPDTGKSGTAGKSSNIRPVNFAASSPASETVRKLKQKRQRLS